MGKTTLRVMYLNAENLFSPGESFYGSTYDEATYFEKINWIAGMIISAQVHVCALTEVGEDEERILPDLMETVNFEGNPIHLPHSFAFEPSKGSAKIRAALLSAFPISDTHSLRDFPDDFAVDLHQVGSGDTESNWLKVPIDEFSRPVAFGQINPPNGATPFKVVIVHLKSKRPSIAQHDGDDRFNAEAIGSARAAIRRNVEAAALRCHLNQALPMQFEADADIPTIVMGDFNDTPTAVPLEIIRGTFDKDPGASSPWTEVDKRSLITAARLHLRKGSHEDKLYSYIHNEAFTMIDQALITKHLVGKFQRMEVLNDHVLRHKDLESTVTVAEQQWKSSVSDHGAIVVEFNRMLRPD
jgi:endonuclease/exonuclease/phosphatase family metal-dependent hydrolase